MSDETPAPKTTDTVPVPAPVAEAPGPTKAKNSKSKAGKKSPKKSPKSSPKPDPEPLPEPEVTASAITSIASISTTPPEPPPPPPKKKKMSMQDVIVDTLIKDCKPYNLKGLAAKTRSTDGVLSSLMPNLQKKGLVKVKEFATAKSSKTLVWANQSHERAKVEKVDMGEMQVRMFSVCLCLARVFFEGATWVWFSSMLSARMKQAF